MDPIFPDLPESFEALDLDALQEFITAMSEALASVTADPSSFVSEDVSAAELLAAARAGAEALQAARAELAGRPETEAAEVESAEDLADDFAALATAVAETEEPEPEGDPEPEGEDEPVTASAEPAVEIEVAPQQRRLPKPGSQHRPVETQQQQVALTAAAAVGGFDKGESFPSMAEIARVMQDSRRRFGIIPEGTSGEQIPIVRADWSHLYPADRKLTSDPYANEEQIERALDPDMLKRELSRRRDNALVASGGLCAPVTPYYNLQMISVAQRPVRAALPAFNADRGGIRNARPAALSAVTTGVGVRTAAEDASATQATKTCQVVDCPPFEETDVEIIFHCLQFGNLGARTFPERVTQWNNLTLAAHARLAETVLLTGIDTASTQVTATDLGLGASATLFSQIMTAANGMRSRHRMDPEAVLRLMMPDWAIDLIISDVYRGQFQRFDVDEARVTALLRSIDVEPTFYIDSASGRGQVYGTQSAGALLPFPDSVTWYLYPEGSFLYVDGGVLELGLVRDSVLNATNDFQIFGESFENVAFVGVESLAVETTVCDSGTVSLPDSVECPIDYLHTS